MPATTPPSRVTVEHAPGEVRVLIRVRRSWGVAVALLAWLCVWSSGEVSVARELAGAWGSARGPGVFQSVWLLCWTAGGLLAMRQLVWSLAGREELAITAKALVVRWAAGPLRRSSTYDLAAIRDLREDPEVAGMSARSVATPTAARRLRGATSGHSGAILFELGATTVRIGSDLEGEDLRKVLALLRERLPCAPSRGEGSR